MAGNIVNQDASLGYVYTTPGAENVSLCIYWYLTDIYLAKQFFLERCHADPDTIVGHLKTHI